MSDHDTRSNTSEEESDRRSAKLTGLAIGGGSSPDRLVGMSSPHLTHPTGRRQSAGTRSLPRFQGQPAPSLEARARHPPRRSRTCRRLPTLNGPPLLASAVAPGKESKRIANTGRGLVHFVHASIINKHLHISWSKFKQPVIGSKIRLGQVLLITYRSQQINRLYTSDHEPMVAANQFRTLAFAFSLPYELTVV